MSVESRASPPATPKLNGRGAVAPPRASRDKQKKPGTGAPLHTKEPVTVASFRTWRGWRENVARNRCLTLYPIKSLSKTGMAADSAGVPTCCRDAACRVSAAATLSIIIVLCPSQNALSSKSLKSVRTAPTRRGLHFCTATKLSRGFQTRQSESIKKKKWKPISRLTKRGWLTSRLVRSACPIRNKAIS